MIPYAIGGRSAKVLCKFYHGRVSYVAANSNIVFLRTSSDPNPLNSNGQAEAGAATLLCCRFLGSRA